VRLNILNLFFLLSWSLKGFSDCILELFHVTDKIRLIDTISFYHSLYFMFICRCELMLVSCEFICLWWRFQSSAFKLGQPLVHIDSSCRLTDFLRLFYYLRRRKLRFKSWCIGTWGRHCTLLWSLVMHIISRCLVAIGCWPKTYWSPVTSFGWTIDWCNGVSMSWVVPFSYFMRIELHWRSDTRSIS
jgi:hypothetical protein